MYCLCHVLTPVPSAWTRHDARQRRLRHNPTAPPRRPHGTTTHPQPATTKVQPAHVRRRRPSASPPPPASSTPRRSPPRPPWSPSPRPTRRASGNEVLVDGRVALRVHQPAAADASPSSSPHLRHRPLAPRAGTDPGARRRVRHGRPGGAVHGAVGARFILGRGYWDDGRSPAAPRARSASRARRPTTPPATSSAARRRRGRDAHRRREAPGPSAPTPRVPGVLLGGGRHRGVQPHHVGVHRRRRPARASSPTCTTPED